MLAYDEGMMRARRPKYQTVSTLLLVLAACVLLWRCAHVPPNVEPLRVTLAGVTLADFNLLEQRYRITLRLQNPNEFRIAIDGVEYRIELNEREFARGVSAARVNVPGFGTALAEVEAVSTLADWLRQAQADTTRQEESLAYRVRGTLRLRDPAVVTVPFDYAGEIRFRP